MKGWKIWYLAIALIFLVSGVVGAILIHNAPDAGLKDVRTIGDLYSCQVRLEWAAGDDVDGSSTAKQTLDCLTSGQNDFLTPAEQAEIVVVASPTGNLEINTGTLGQEIVIHEIRRGEDTLSVNDKCMVWMGLGLQVMDGQITWRSIINLMQPGHEYLLFLNDTTLNKKMNGSDYRLVDSWFPYVEIPFAPIEPLPDDVRTAPYSQWATYPSFTANQEIADAANAIVRELLNLYGN